MQVNPFTHCLFTVKSISVADPRKIQREVFKLFKWGKSWKHCIASDWCSHVFFVLRWFSSQSLLTQSSEGLQGLFCVCKAVPPLIFSVSQAYREWTLTPPRCCRTEIKLSTSLFFFSRELHEEVDNTTTISFNTEDWSQVNSMGLTNRQDHTAHLWDSGRPLHPIVNMTNEKKYPIKLAFVCAQLLESCVCLARSSLWS